MRRATAGSWLNYATTLLFQILFAKRFGTSDVAAAFQLTYALWVALTAIFTSTLTAVLVPRLNDAADEYAILRGLQVVAALAVGTGGFVFAAAPAIAQHLLGSYRVPLGDLTSLVRATGAMIVIQAACDLGIACCVARGQRFTATFAPAGPSLGGALALTIHPAISAPDLYVWIIAGSVAEFGLVLPALRLVRRADSRGKSIVRLLFATMGQFGLTSLLAPLELLLASAIVSARDSSHYAYAARSLAVAQQLLIGGIVVSLLGTWARTAMTQPHARSREQVGRAVSLVIWTVGPAVAVAVLVGQDLIRVLYQRGEFTAADTRAVYVLMLLALPGFALDAISVTVSPMILSRLRNDLAIRTGLTRFAVRVALIVLGGFAWGIDGVPVAWSVASVVGLSLNLRWLRVEGVAPGVRSLATSLWFASGCVAAGTTGALALPGNATTARAAIAIVILGIAAGVGYLHFRERLPISLEPDAA